MSPTARPEGFSELWAQLARYVPSPRDDRPGQPVYAISEPPDRLPPLVAPSIRTQPDA